MTHDDATIINLIHAIVLPWHPGFQLVSETIFFQKPFVCCFDNHANFSIDPSLHEMATPSPRRLDCAVRKLPPELRLYVHGSWLDRRQLYSASESGERKIFQKIVFHSDS